MGLHAYAGFLTGILLLLLMPGPTNTLIMTAGTSQPLRRLLKLQMAEVAAYLIAVTLLLMLETALGNWRALGAIGLKSIAIGIVLFLAYRLWRHRRLAAAESGALISPRAIFLVTLFNPKSLVFAFALFSPVAGPADLATRLALFAILIVACGWVWIGAGQMLAHGRLARNGLIPALSAAALCAFALYLGSSVVAAAMTL
jgi:threonine/homoserine/homoserine lactone efflux protein